MMKKNNNLYQEYNTNYIEGVMSLRKPQAESLEILDDIMSSINLDKNINLDKTLKIINSKYPTCTDFERDFLSLTFALATGVGKTRLMGAFIAYLYTNYNIKNFFIVAPSNTIYEKLKRETVDPSHEKYLFNGLGCFVNPPNIITDEDYRNRHISSYSSDVEIFIYNIQKFDSENVNMKKGNENIGDSFFNYLSNLNDLVILMDESHHYRADSGMNAINELNPILGLELTATPTVAKTNENFKNVVLEYPLSSAIRDGYTRTPYALTRANIDFSNFGDVELDKVMLIDGLNYHESIKKKLKTYAHNNSSDNNQIRVVKPFTLIVCKDTKHADEIEKIIKSDDFKNGYYKDKTITVHSKKGKSESDENQRLLIEVEKSDNPIEIVIHVDKLKEGWDVNNLFTIIPLRTAASKILREQMVGRGLRLPYGKRTGEKWIDSVMLTAHDNFIKLLEEAQKGDSIFKAGNIIDVENIDNEEVSIPKFNIKNSIKEQHKNYYMKTKVKKSDNTDKLLDSLNKKVEIKTLSNINKTANTNVDKNIIKNIIKEIKVETKDNNEFSEMFNEKEYSFDEYLKTIITKTQNAIKERMIPIPKLKLIDSGVENYAFVEFDLDILEFNHTPILNDKNIVQNLENLSDRETIKSESINYNDINEKKIIAQLLNEKPEIDYSKCRELIIKLINQLISHYSNKYNEIEIKNIIFNNKREISNKIYAQMVNEKHFYSDNGDLIEEVEMFNNYNHPPQYTFLEKKNLYENYKGDIKSVLFTDIRKGVFDETKFDSYPELLFARILERDIDVINWLRPSARDFNITYNRGKKYVPDFLVETNNAFYLIEVKGEDKLKSADVIAKSKRAIKYCDTVSKYAKENKLKDWKYVFIPSKQIKENSSFNQLTKQFTLSEEM